ncbi:MAG TPA: hypothetical protein VGQ94_04205 [Terriglobales bacterium]|nr:hypothetical protein [Terriglobales bacterium]
MRRFVLLMIAITLAPSVCAQIASSRSALRPARALWVWKPALFEDPGELEALLAFTAKKRTSTIFFSAATQRLQHEPELYRRLIRRAHAQGITVQALNGEPDWLFPDRRSGAVAFLEAVRHYDGESRPTERFDAIHLDVEPQSLPEWKAVRHEDLAARYLAFVDWIRDQARPLALPLVVDVPVSFNRITAGPRSMSEAVLDRADQIVVMTYKDTAQKVVDANRAKMESADAAGKKLWIGISADPSHLPANSASGPAESDLEAIAASVEAAFQRHPSFLGVAIHDYARYRRLVP